MPPVKWLVVAAILAYVAFRAYVAVRPRSPLARAFRRRVILRTDAHAMTRKELALSALSFLAFGLLGVGLFVGVTTGSERLGWAMFEARPVMVLGKAGLFVGAMALVTGLFLLGAAVWRRG